MNNSEEIKSNKSDCSGLNQSSWDSLKKLKALSKNLHNLNANHFQTGKYLPTQHLNSSMPNFFDEEANGSISNNTTTNFKSLTMPHQVHSHTSQNEIIEGSIPLSSSNSLSPEEMKSQLDILKQAYQKKLNDIDTVYKELIAKDEKIQDLTAIISKHLHGVDNTRNVKCDDTTSQKLKEISEMRMEINNLKRKHNKKLQDIQRENQEKLKGNLAQIKEEYNMRMKEFSEGHDKNIKQLQENIFKLREKLDCYEKNKDKYITKEEHEKALNQLSKDHNNELAPYEKEIEKMEAFLKDNYSHLNLLKNKNQNLEESNFFNLADIQRELQNGNESNDIVCLISQLDTPLCTSNNGIPISIHTKKSTSGMICTTNANKQPNISCIENDQDLVDEESAEFVYEEVKINRINHFQNQHMQFSEKI